MNTTTFHTKPKHFIIILIYIYIYIYILERDFFMYAVSSGLEARDGTCLTIPAVGVPPFNPPPTCVLPVRVVHMT